MLQKSTQGGKMQANEYELPCPGCGKEKTPCWMIGSRNYSMQRLDVPYFMCGECRLICVNKTAVRKAISQWKNNLLTRKHLPSNEVLYKEMLKILDEVTEYYCRTAGYRRAKFKSV